MSKRKKRKNKNHDDIIVVNVTKNKRNIRTINLDDDKNIADSGKNNINQ
tara:strand:+ start:568 stop:714 length:147 start_codon:yes stop_codon:yes gene_type:complete